MPLSSSVMGQMMARFCNFYSLRKVNIWLKEAQNSTISFTIITQKANQQYRETVISPLQMNG